MDEQQTKRSGPGRFLWLLVIIAIVVMWWYFRPETDNGVTQTHRNNGVIASFSRALTEGLTAQQSDEEFNSTLDQAIAGIAKASAT